MTAPLPAALSRMLRKALAGPTMVSDRLLMLRDFVMAAETLSSSDEEAEALLRLAEVAEKLAPIFATIEPVISPGPAAPPLTGLRSNALRHMAEVWCADDKATGDWLNACADALETHAEAIRHG